MPARRKALVTNDDGIDAPGLVALAAAAVAAGLEVVVAAPARQSSGASAGIIATTRQGQTPIERRKLTELPGVEAYAVAAQPAYIVRAAVRGWLDPAPELVLAGVNHGANLGRAILHSGTVGAALTAGLNGLPGLAVSLDVGWHPAGAPHWSTVGHLLPDVLGLLAVLRPAPCSRLTSQIGQPRRWASCATPHSRSSAPCRPPSTGWTTASCTSRKSRRGPRRRRVPTAPCSRPGIRP